MKDPKNFFIFFSGILWATSLSSFSKYSPFDTTNLCGKDANKNWLRLLVSFIFINIIPMVYIYFTFNCVIKKKDLDFSSFIGVVLLTIALAGIIRIYHAIIFTRFSKYFYNNKLRNNINKEMFHIENSKSFCNNFFPGLAYWLFFGL